MLSYLSLCASLVLPTLHIVHAADTACDVTCLANLTSTWEASQHVDPDFIWYKTPSNFSTSLKPGSLLEVEYVTNLSEGYVVPAGLSMSRIIYTTTDVHDNILPASAYILWPYQPQIASAGGYQMVAWAHGTTGVFQPCAPSNYRNLQYNFMVPFELALDGYI